MDLSDWWFHYQRERTVQRIWGMSFLRRGRNFQVKMFSRQLAMLEVGTRSIDEGVSLTEKSKKRMTQRKIVTC